MTDEQAHGGDSAIRAGAVGYGINVGTYKNGVTYGSRWTHLDGFSEAIVQWIAGSESASVQ